MRRGLGGSFGYNRAERAEHLLSPKAIVALLTEVVAKGGHLLLSVGPDASGRVPDLHVRLLQVVGAWVRRFGALIDRSRPWTTWGDEHARYLVLDGEVHAVDVDGGGRFAALGRAAGVVRSVVRADDPDLRPIEFEQSDDQLRIARRGRFDRTIDADGVDVAVYRVALEPLPEAPIELFPPAVQAPIELAALLAGARPGSIVQLGDGTYLGPARIPDGVTVRGLGPHRTFIDGVESHAVSSGPTPAWSTARCAAAARASCGCRRWRRCWPGDSAVMIGCTVEGHVEIAADDCRVTSCALTGVVAKSVDHVDDLAVVVARHELGLCDRDRSGHRSSRREL